VQAVINAADEAIGAVDQVALAQFVALKNPEEGTEAPKKKKEMNEVKAGLVDALAQKCRALVEMLPKVHF
jgi:tripeptidyl-peptidase-2